MKPRLLALCACALLAFGSACKRRETIKVEIFDEAAPPGLTEALGALAPPWPAPERVVLGDGLLVHWLREQNTPAVHLRLVFPTADLKPAQQGAAALIAARSVALELEMLAAHEGGFDLTARGHVKSWIARGENQLNLALAA